MANKPDRYNLVNPELTQEIDHLKGSIESRGLEQCISQISLVP